MREFYNRRIQKKGKRILSGIIAVTLAVIMAIPVNFPVMKANAEENKGSSIQITGGTIKKVKYLEWLQDTSEGAAEDAEKQENEEELPVGSREKEFGDKIVSQITVQYETEPEYVLGRVEKNGTILKNDEYSINKEDGTITYDAGEKNNIGAIQIYFIPQELQISNLKAERGTDEAENPAESVNLSWSIPEITEESAYSLGEYRLIIRKEVKDKTTIIFDETYPVDDDGIPVCTYEDKESNAVSATATYTVSVVAETAYQEDCANLFYGEGKSAEWKAVYDLQLSVNGNGKVKIGETEYGSSDVPYIIYNIPEVSEGETNLEMLISQEKQYGVSSLCVNGNEEKQEIENNTYKMRIEQNSNIAISFAVSAEVPSITTSGDKYTEIAQNGTVEITSAEDVENTSYRYESLDTPQKQPKWKEYPQNLKGASNTAEISAAELFGTESYAILRAYSSRQGYADSKVVEQYYYLEPETPQAGEVSFQDGYCLGQWSMNEVTLNYQDKSAREYASLQIGYAVNGHEMVWKDMNPQGNQYAYTFSQSGDYSIALRYKMDDPNHPGGFVYGESLSLSDNIKIDMETPSLKATGYTSAVWTSEDVCLNLQNKTKQISGTRYQYVASEEPAEIITSPEWKECENNNQVKVSCADGEILTRYIYLKAVSNAGKESQITCYQVMIDKEKPEVPEVSFSNIDGKNGWHKTLPVIAMEQVQQDEGSHTSIYYKMYQEGQNPDMIQEVLFNGANQPTILNDGLYTFRYYAKDTAGNKSEIAEQKFKVDTGAPNAPAIEFKTENDSVLAHIIHFITFGYFCNERVVAVVHSSDSMSQVKEYGVWYMQDGKTSSVSTIQGEQARIELPENFKGTVSAYAVDYAGNQSQTSESDGIVYENNQAEITITTDVDHSKWQNKDVNFHVITQDVQSGLKNVEYILNGKTIYKNDFTESSYSDVVYMDQQDVRAEEEAVSSAGYTLQVKVTDNAGNQSEKSMVVYIDKTAPAISLSGIENGVYSNNTETLTIEVDEQIYDLNQVTVSATRTLDGVTYEYGVEGFISDHVDAKKNYSFSEDGLYVVNVNAVDAAGNVAVPKQITFTIDKTAPQIELNGPQNDSYHSSDVSVDVKVEESFFDTDTVTINVTKTLDGQTSSVEFGNWTNQGKSSSLEKSFSEDGTYQIEVQAKDAAGNQAASQQLMFTVDKTAPEVSINGAGDYQITGNTITLSYDVVESYFDTNNVSVQVQKEDLAGNVTDISVGDWVNSGKESALSYELKEDGIYTSVITAVDKAGNESTVQKTVTVDTSDPIIRHVDEMNGKYYQTFQLPYELSEMIADLTVPDVAMYLNSDEYDGISEVAEEGKYVFKMDVSDEVGHKALAQAEFMVDNTAPKFIFNGVEDGMKSQDNISWSVSLADAKDSLKEVLVDGEKKDFNKENNTYQETFSSKGTHTIEVKAEDLAGNVTKKAISVTISEESVIAAMGANKPFVIGGVAVAAGAVGVGAGYATGLFGKGTGKKIFKKRIKK